MSLTANRPSQRLVDIVGSLKGTWHGWTAMCRCPVHNDQTPSLALRQGDRGILVHCFAGCTPEAILRELDRVKPNQNYVFNEAPAPPRSANIERLWMASIPVGGTLAEKYLRRRGIPIDVPNVRFHPRCPRGRSPQAVFKPAVMVGVHEGKELRAIQRIFLDPSGTNYTEKVMIGSPVRGAWQGSFGEGETLAIAEGFEDAARYSCINGVPAWASLGAERLHLLAIPASVRTIILAEDNDPEGARAARRAAHAYRDQGLSVRRHSSRPHKDWAAVPIEG
jgi:hypothetical protein